MGGRGRAGRANLLVSWGRFNYYPDTNWATFQQFPGKWIFGRNSLFLTNFFVYFNTFLVFQNKSPCKFWSIESKIPTIFLKLTMNTWIYYIALTMIKFQKMGLQKLVILGGKTKCNILKKFSMADWDFYIILCFQIGINTTSVLRIYKILRRFNCIMWSKFFILRYDNNC